VPEIPAPGAAYAFVKLPMLAPGPIDVFANPPTPGANEDDTAPVLAFVTKAGLT
jgi:hypothetical protein